MNSRDTSIKDLQEALSESLSKNEKLTQHATQLNAYLGNMPTMEEHHALLEQVNIKNIITMFLMLSLIIVCMYLY